MSTPETPPPAGGDEPGRGMTGVQRAGIILGGLAVLLIAFLIIRGGGDDSGDQASSSAAQTTSTQTASTASTQSGGTTEAGDDSGGGGSGGGGSGGGGGGGSDDSGGGGSDDSGGGATPAAQTITVVNGQPEGGVKTVSFKKGDQIRLKVVSDVADEIHVHGSDLMKDVEKGGSVEFSFKATIEGRFEVELENAGTQIANLEVTPS